MVVIAKLALINSEATTALHGMRFLSEKYEEQGNKFYAEKFERVAKKIEKAIEKSNTKNISSDKTKKNTESRIPKIN